MVWGWLRLKPAAHRFAAALNISHRFRKREFPARYYLEPVPEEKSLAELGWDRPELDLKPSQMGVATQKMPL